MKTCWHGITCVTVCGIAFLASVAEAAPIGTSFSYQVQLDKDDVTLDSFCNFEFDLWDDSSAGNQVGSTLQFLFVPVVGGVANVELDFGDVFGPGDRWLGVRVQCIGDASFTTLDPRQQITPSPQAAWANKAPQQIATGIIMAWSGPLADIPEGWVLCDGNSGTPDLQDRFVLSVMRTEDPGEVGGEVSHGHDVPHAHAVDPPVVGTSTDGTHAHTQTSHDHSADPAQIDLASIGDHAHTANPPNTSTSTDGAHSHSVDPPNTSTTSTGSHTHSVGSTGGSSGWAGSHSDIFGCCDDNMVQTHSHSMTSAGNHSHTANYGTVGSSAFAGHSHTADLPAVGTTSTGSHSHTLDVAPTASSVATQDSSPGGQHSHTIDVPGFDSAVSAPLTDPANHLPPYYDVAFLMKVDDPPLASKVATRSSEGAYQLAAWSGEQSDAAASGFNPAIPDLFMFQGTMKRSGVGVNGSCEVGFDLWDADTSGNQLGSIAPAAVEFRDGAFATNLDFGGLALNGTAGWVEVSVQCPGDSTPVQLGQRQPLRSVPVTLFAKQSPSQIPDGTIFLWSGVLSDVPAGWGICDGTQGTPDLRDRFLRGAPAGVEPGSMGGALTHDHTLGPHNHSIDLPSATSNGVGKHAHSMAPHSHTVNPPNSSTSSVASHTHSANPPSANTAAGGSHTHSVDVPNGATTTNGSHSHTLNQVCGDFGTVGGNQDQNIPICHTHSSGSDGNHNHSINPASTTTTTVSAHSHSVNVGAATTSSGGGHSHGVDLATTDTNAALIFVQPGDNHDHVFDGPTVSSTLASPTVATGDNVPSYYKLAFIMKLSPAPAVTAAGSWDSDGSLRGTHSENAHE